MDVKEQTRQLFDLIAEGYDNPSMRYFPFAGDQLSDRLKLKPGERVLDAAAGTGAFTAAAAQAVYAGGGRVQAIDLSDNMLRQAEKTLAKMQLDNVDMHIMDAANPEFRSDYFDAIGCSFGLFFFEDMEGALRQWYRVLKPGGRVMFTSFSPTAFQPLMNIFFEDLKAVGFTPPGETPRPSDRLPSQDYCKQLLTDAGFVDVDSQEKQLGYHLGKTEDWWEILWNAGMRNYLEALTPEQLTEFRKIHLPHIEAQRVEDGIWLDVTVWFSGGVKPQNG